MMRRFTAGRSCWTFSSSRHRIGRAVERHLLDELEERRADLGDGCVVIQVLAVDVGDHRQNRAELQERAVAFVGFDHQEIALSHARVGAAHGRGFSADHHRRIEAAGIEDRSGHGRGGGFAVAAGDGDAVFQAHQFGQQFAARDDRELQTARFLDFGIAASTAELTTRAFAPATFSAAWPS